MIDIVIPLGKGSDHDNFELRCCLRGIEKYVSNYRNIIIVGECPEWVQNVIHIPAKDESYKDKNIMNKILLACQSDITDEFLFFNDDHFITRSIDATTYPYYYSGDLSELKGKSSRWDSGIQAVQNTIHALDKLDLPIKHFDIHCPIRYKAKYFEGIMKGYDWGIQSAYVVKSLYCNSLKIEGEPMIDCKINEHLHPFALADKIVHRHVFSVGDYGMNDYMIRFLKDTYNKRGGYERV